MVDVLTDPKIWLLISVMSVVGAFARLANYYLGLRGRDTIESIYPRVKPETWDRVLLSYQHLSRLPLLLASIPIIGTVLTIGAGMAGIEWRHTGIIQSLRRTIHCQRATRHLGRL